MPAQTRPPIGAGSIIVYVDPLAGIVTSGKVPTLNAAKAQFETAWRQWLAWAKLAER
jgi:hypothetical protein